MKTTKTKQPETAWKDFVTGQWRTQIDVRNFIQSNYNTLMKVLKIF